MKQFYFYTMNSFIFIIKQFFLETLFTIRSPNIYKSFWFIHCKVIIYRLTFISWPLTSRILIEMSKWIESPCYIVIVLNTYLNLYYICTKILEYWKDVLVRSSLRWWTLIKTIDTNRQRNHDMIYVTHNFNTNFLRIISVDIFFQGQRW